MNSGNQNPFFNEETELSQEVLCMFYEKLNPLSLVSLSQTCSFFAYSLQEYKSPELIKRNIKNSNYEKRIFNGQKEKIHQLVAWKNLIIASSFSRVQAYDTRTGEIAWTFEGVSVLHDKLWIVDGKIVCNGWELINGSHHHDGNTIISVLEIETGKVLQTIRHPQLQSDAITVFGKHVFAKLTSGAIFSANSEGNFKQYKSHPYTSGTFANENYIIDLHPERTGFNIISRETGIPNSIKLDNREGIFCTTIINNILICGMADAAYDLLIVDLDKGEIIKKYKAENVFLDIYPTPGIFPDINIPGIHSVVANNQYAFISHECGTVIAVDLNTYKHVVLENKLTPHSVRLSLQDNYLFIISTKIKDVPATLHIWDINTMQKVNSLQIDGLHNSLLWHKGQLFMTSGNSLIKRDFKVAYKGEGLAMESPELIDTEEENRNNPGCTIS
jgi:hypothetical protein